MAKQLFFIYTNPRFFEALYAPFLSKCFANCDKSTVRFVCDDSLAAETMANHLTPTPGVTRRLYNLVENCASAGADCVIVGCTAINLAVQQLVPFASAPLIGIDEPLVRAVCASVTRRVTLLSHSRVNADTVARRIRFCAAPDMEVACLVPDGAAEAFKSGDTALLESILFGAAKQCMETGGEVAFTHIGTDAMRGLDALPRPAFRIGRLAVQAIGAATGHSYEYK